MKEDTLDGCQRSVRTIQNEVWDDCGELTNHQQTPMLMDY